MPPIYSSDQNTWHTYKTSDSSVPCRRHIMYYAGAWLLIVSLPISQHHNKRACLQIPLHQVQVAPQKLKAGGRGLQQKQKAGSMQLYLFQTSIVPMSSKYTHIKNIYIIHTFNSLNIKVLHVSNMIKMW